MAWIDIANSEIDVDSILSAALMATFRDNQLETRRFGFGWEITETTVTETSFASKKTLPATFPNCEGANQRSVSVRLQAKVSAGTLTLRLRDVANATVSAEVPVTGTSYAWYTLTLNVAEPLRGDDMTWEIEGKVASAGPTGYIYAAPSLNCEVRY